MTKGLGCPLMARRDSRLPLLRPGRRFSEPIFLCFMMIARSTPNTTYHDIDANAGYDGSECV